MKIKNKKLTKFIDKLNENNTINRDLIFILILTPIILYLIISSFNSIRNFFPSPVFGDETGYYRVTHSFVNAESFGNYGVTYSENVSAKYGGFSAHGPKYTILYSIFANFIGWYPYTILVCNIALLIIALITLTHILKLDNKQLILLILLMFSFFPLLYFLVSGMVEMVQYFFFIIYSATLYLLIKKQKRILFIINLILIFIMTLFRINYFILYLPVIFIYNNKKFNKKLIGWTLMSIVLTLISYWFIGIFSAPYPSYLSDVINLILNFKIGDCFSLVFSHLVQTTKDYFSFEVNSKVEIIFNYVYFITIIIYGIIGFYKLKNKEKNNIYLVNFFITFISFLIVLFLYSVTIYKSVRVLGPFLFLSIMLLINDRKYLSSLIHLIVLVVITMFIIKYEVFINNAKNTFTTGDLISEPQSVQQINDSIVCKENNRWEQTVSVPNSYSYSFNIIAGLKPCIGINYILGSDYSKINDSKYILVDSDETINKEKYKFVLKNNLGILYEKIESEE